MAKYKNRNKHKAPINVKRTPTTQINEPKSESLTTTNKRMDYSTKLALIALIISIITGVFGIFGGIPGIKQLFFSQPNIKIDGFLPVAVYDQGYNEESQFPKFSFKGVLKVSNPNSYDISLNEMKLYGVVKDTQGIKFDNGKPVFYELNLPGMIDTGETVVKGYGTTYLKFNFGHLSNDEQPGTYRGIGSGGQATEIGKPDFQVFLPNYALLFKPNKFRLPYEFVDEISSGKLNFAVNFNSQLVKIPTNSILYLHRFSLDEWSNNERVVNFYNKAITLKNSTY